jgi:hypothetical protein
MANGSNGHEQCKVGVLVFEYLRDRRRGFLAHAARRIDAAHESDPFIARVSITVAILAVLAAVAGSLETVEGGRALGSSSEAVLNQDQATDSWNEFQADSLKNKMYSIAADGGGEKATDYKNAAKEENDKKLKVGKEARAFEAKRDELLAEARAHEDRHHWLTGAATLFEIGIALSTVAIITRRRWLWGTATVFGTCGIILLGVTYLL